MNPVDALLNRLTMYRVVLYGLIATSLIGITMAFAGILPFGGVAAVVSFALIPAVGLAANRIFTWAFNATANTESAAITSLILFLILAPPANTREAIAIALTTVVAIAAKFLLAWKKRHIFNPAAIGAVILGLLGSGQATWWVGSAAMLIPVTLTGFLVVRKVRKLQVVGTFIVVGVATIMFASALRGFFTADLLPEIFLSWPIVFLGNIMLTEPLTMPGRHRQQFLYAATVGLLFGSQLHIGPVTMTPELALAAGNLLAFAVSPRQRMQLTLKSITRVATGTYDFSFTPDSRPTYLPGQYMEWTLEHHPVDGRGNRRYFTVASSPTEPEVHLGVRINDQGSSSFKAALLRMKPGDSMVAGQLTGDFVLPADTGRKLLFIAGGIGVTPFRSIIKHATDTNQHRDIVLLYVAGSPDAFAYSDVLAEAEKAVGLKVVRIVSGANPPAGWRGEVGPVDTEKLKRLVPDFAGRRVYLSGPGAMVNAYRAVARKAGIPRSQIVTDYFPGF